MPRPRKASKEVAYGLRLEWVPMKFRLTMIGPDIESAEIGPTRGVGANAIKREWEDRYEVKVRVNFKDGRVTISDGTHVHHFSASADLIATEGSFQMMAKHLGVIEARETVRRGANYTMKYIDSDKVQPPRVPREERGPLVRLAIDYTAAIYGKAK